MKIIPFFILLIFPIFANSQNWSLFNLNQKSYYAQDLGSIIRVESFNPDSIKIDEYQTIYFNRKIGLSDECYNNIVQEANWIMSDWRNPNLIDSLILTGDSVLYISEFYTSNIDTFLFLPNTEVGDTWITTQNNIQITCVEKGTEYILGIEDSIKTFNVLTNPYDTIQFILSKSYGLIKFLPLREFIYHYQNNDFEPYFRLIGYETESLIKGYTQPKFSDYFHLHQGDKLFWRLYSNPDDITQPETINYQVDSITSAYISNDSVNYHYQMKRYDENGNLYFTGNYSYIYTDYREGEILQTPTSWFDVMPPNYFTNDVYFSESLYLFIEDSDTISNFGYSVWGLMIDTSDCTTGTAADYDQTVRFSTREGLIYIASFSWGEYSTTIIGSIINGIVYGNTNLPTNIKCLKEKELIIHPNPTTGIVNIVTNDQIILITVMDITGKIITKTKNSKIDLSNQKQGIYFIKIDTESGILIDKILLRR